MSNLSEPIQLTRDEYRNITRCLGDENFQKLFAEYCSELSDPENRLQYEKELKLLEAERGYDVKFIKPLPGYVIKTTTKEDNKIFINVCHSDLVGMPESKATKNGIGQKGLEWSIPYAQTHPRKDYDNRKNECVVYDVVFHYDTLHLAKQNANFRKLVTDTAVDAVESSFNVPLNKINLKFPKLQYKGVPKMSVIRQKANNSSNENHQVVKKSTKKFDNNDNTDNKENMNHTANNEFATPKFKLVHKKSVDYFEMTNERNDSDVKPDEIVIEVELPLLNSASDCVLNVTQQELHLISHEPARYKLQVKLPFEVSEKSGSAKFNTDEKTLTISLPVIKKTAFQLKGSNNVVCTNNSPVSEKCDSKTVQNESKKEMISLTKTAVGNNFENRKKLFPKFSTNKMDSIFAFTLNVRNVDPASIEVQKGTDTVKCEFSNIGSGFFPSYYVFFARFPNANICDIEYEEWKNCLILKVILDSSQLDCYYVGVDEDDLTEYSIMEHITDKKNKFGKEIEDDSLCIAVSKSTAKQERKLSNMSIEIKTKHNSGTECINMEDENAGGEDKTDPSVKSLEHMQKDDITEESGTLEAELNATEDNTENCQESKKQKRHPRRKHKKRSLSESCCDQLKVILENETAKMEPEQVQNKQSAGEEDDVYPEKQQRKGRSVSESCSLEPETAKAKESHVVPNVLSQLNRKSSHRGILKYASLERSISECSDDHYLASSIDSTTVTNSLEQPNSYLSDSCRKTVRFNEFIKTKLFRLY
uniref:Protein kintoun n=1 Tax=Culex tarsalis TaxID=7177 RepID=A0A1Q3FYN8_CULTA